jgi:predicted O-methyltransferase YrrM
MASSDKADANKAEASKKGPRAIKMDRKDGIRKRVLARLGGVKTIVEIGVWRGRFSDVLLSTMNPKKLYLVDPWIATSEDEAEDALTTAKNGAQMEQIHNAVNNRFSDQIEAGQVEIIRDYSANALTAFDDGSIDLIYIDGDHTYEAVKTDIQLAWQKIRPGGYIMLDDYHRQGWWGDGVLRAVHEFVGTQNGDIRIHDVLGSQIALEKFNPEA